MTAIATHRCLIIIYESREAMNRKLKSIMILGVFIWLITNFHHPVTPSHFTSLNMPNHIFGTSYAMMVFGSFLTAPIWGSWGDRNGRRKVLVYSVFLYGLGQIGLALSTRMIGILFFRGVSGMANGGFSGGLMASIVDTTTEENRGVIMSRYTAMMLIMASVGFLVGGILGYFSSKTVMLIQGISMLLVSLFYGMTAEETNVHRYEGENQKVMFIWNILRDNKKSKEVFTSGMIIFLGLTFFTYIAQSSNGNAFNYYLKEQLDFKPIVNGIWKMVTGISGLIANLTINSWILRKKNAQSSIVGLTAIGVISGLMVLLDVSTIGFMIWNLIFFTIITILIPILQGLAVEGQASDVGFISGVYNAVRALGEVVGSIFAGFSYNMSSLAPFVLAAFSLGIAMVFGIIRLKKVKAIIE